MLLQGSNATDPEMDVLYFVLRLLKSCVRVLIHGRLCAVLCFFVYGTNVKSRHSKYDIS